MTAKPKSSTKSPVAAKPKSSTKTPVADVPSCSTKCSIPLPKGVTAHCYANDDTQYPTKDQFCAFEQDGFLEEAPGCCTTVCPSEICPSVKPADPWTRPAGIKTNPKSKKDEEPFPFLLKMILIVFAILLVAAGIFLSVSN